MGGGGGGGVIIIFCFAKSVVGSDDEAYYQVKPKEATGVHVNAAVGLKSSCTPPVTTALYDSNVMLNV